MTFVGRLNDLRLTATTVPIDPAIDLVGVAGDDGILWERADGVSLAGQGVAARLPVPWNGDEPGRAVADVLADIASDGPHPPVALGALPFLRSEPAHLVVPAVLVRRLADGSCWLTVTGSDRDGGANQTVDDIRRRLQSTGPEAP